MLAHVPVPAPQQPHTLPPLASLDSVLGVPAPQQQRVEHQGCAGTGDAALGAQHQGWDRGAGCPGSRYKVPKLSSCQCCRMLWHLPQLWLPKGHPGPLWRWGDDGKLGDSHSSGGSNGHRDQPLPLEGCAALGQVPRAGHLHPWQLWGLDSQAAVWEGDVGQGPLMTTSTITAAALGPCPGEGGATLALQGSSSQWSLRAISSFN